MIFVIGANPTSNHPVAATWMKNAVERGAKLIVADPRRNDLARHAWRFLQFTADMDVALLNAMIYTIIEEDLVDKEFIRQRTSGYEALKENAKGFSPEAMAPLCGIPAETIREVARAYATSKASMILWGMGISQHVHGTDNARCLIALTLMTGPDRPSRHGAASAARPEQRAGRVRRGPDPDDVSRTTSASTIPRRSSASRSSGAARLDQKPGLTVVEIMDAACDGKIKGMYIMGENPAMSDPNAHHAREGLATPRVPRRAGHLPHRDRVSRRRRAAGLRVAREDRHGDQHRPHGAARPPRARHAGRCAPGPVDHPAARQPPRLRLELHGPGERRGRRSTRRCARR